MTCKQEDENLACNSARNNRSNLKISTFLNRKVRAEEMIEVPFLL